MTPKMAKQNPKKLYQGGFAEYTYPHFQNSQEFALDCGEMFDTFVNSNESHEDGVFTLVFNRSLTFELKKFCV